MRARKDNDLLEFSHFLFTQFDKHERIQALAKGADLVSSEEYWKILGEVWTSNESIFQDIDLISDLWQGMGVHDISDRHFCMDKSYRETLESLPENVEIWRGCYEGNLLGWSWTLDKDTAQFFADRFIPDGKPIISKTLIQKKYLIAFFDSRNEKEVVLDPSVLVFDPKEYSQKHYKPEIGKVYIERLPEKQQSNSSAIFWLAQTGRLNTGQTPELRALLAKASGINWESIENSFKKAIVNFEHYGFYDEAQSKEEEMEIYRKIYEDKELTLENFDPNKNEEPPKP